MSSVPAERVPPRPAKLVEEKLVLYYFVAALLSLIHI